MIKAVRKKALMLDAKYYTLKTGDIVYWDTDSFGKVSWKLITHENVVLKRGVVEPGEALLVTA